jgi:hydroxymethylpyrimidine pyrophosphatase-like HAD family hydrolase
MILAIDFDGTIVEHRYPKIGEPLPGALETLRDLKAAGHRLILWTCREDQGYLIDKQYLSDAVKFCEENGVVFDAVNETLPEEEFRSEKYPRRKPYAHYYIDDAIIGGFPGWDKIREVIIG